MRLKNIIKAIKICRKKLESILASKDIGWKFVYTWQPKNFINAITYKIVMQLIIYKEVSKKLKI